MTGYLTKVKPEELKAGDKVREQEIALRIPNAEVMDIFRKSVVEWFYDKAINSDRRELFHVLWSGNGENLTELLSDLLFDTISYHDYAESFYHAFVTGLVSSAGYIVESNYEWDWKIGYCDQRPQKPPGSSHRNKDCRGRR